MSEGLLSVVFAGCLVLSACQPPPPPATNALLSGEVLFESTTGDVLIDGAQVEAVLEGRVVSQTRTDRNGRFKLHELPSAPFNLRVSKGSEFAEYDYQTTHGRLLSVGEFWNSRKFLPIHLQGHLTILNGKVVSMDDQRPVVGAAVRTYPRTVEDKTDADGRYEIRSGSFAEGLDYRVEAAHGDYNSAMSGAFHLEIGVTRDLPAIELKPRHLDEKGIDGGEMDNKGEGPGNTIPGEK